ncbi:MAG: ABC transporter substrate-binding protein [Burkholderiaceae bacterium]
MQRKLIGAALSAAMIFSGAVSAAEKPDALKVGITAFLSGPASVFGEPAKAAAEILIEDMNKAGGIGGVPMKAFWVDEGAGGEALLAEYRRLVGDEGVDAMFASISSGNCNKIAPLAEDLKILNIMWDCGTQRIFEENKYRYVFRSQGNATPEMLASAVYLIKNKPDFKTIAVVNQDYAWGRDSWAMFSTALKALKPDVKIVGEFFPKFGSPDFSTEISRLSAMRPDVIFSTSWGGDLETFVKQSHQRGLTKRSTFVMPVGEASIQRIGNSITEGHIVGARGDHYFLRPGVRDDPKFQDFVKRYKEKTGDYPIYPTFHISQAIAALKGAYEKAIAANGGEWPDREQVVDAMKGSTFRGLGGEITLREDNQGLEDQLLGTTAKVEGYDFMLLDNMMLFKGSEMMGPVGQVSIEWLKTLKPGFVDSATVSKHGHGQ